MNNEAISTKPEQVRRLILQSIIQQELKVGDRLPSRPEWRRRLGVSNDTLDRALRLLTDEGVLSARTGSGTYLSRAVAIPEHMARKLVVDVLVPSELVQLKNSQSAHVVLRRLDGISRACQKNGMATSLRFLNPYKYLDLEDLLDQLGPLHDGAVFLHDELLARLEEHLTEKHIPFAVVGDTAYHSNAVIVSVQQACREMLAHLVGIRRTRIAYLSSDPAECHSHHAIIQQAAAERGLKLAQIYWVDQDVRLVLERLLSRELKERSIDVVVCRNDQWALETLATLARNGIRVPQDVVVVGCDDIAEAARAEPALATIAMPFEETGETAVAMLAKLIRSGTNSAENITLESRFVPRLSALPSVGQSAASVTPNEGAFHAHQKS